MPSSVESIPPELEDLLAESDIAIMEVTEKDDLQKILCNWKVSVPNQGEKVFHLMGKFINVIETASAPKRGSTTPRSSAATSCDSIMGEWAEGTFSKVEIVCVNNASTPPHGFIPPFWK